ncbi:methylmalonyl-CoA mutase family protein [Pannonibacter phragmitetus]|uniref:methylmalonyl-CoA mutase family protein n=1 Tax=Pannonibacter phragmitetus TaxID=121719 RepID=UPI003D2EBE1E
MAELHPDWTPDETAWLAAVDKALKGAPRERLVARNEDGLAIAPLYPRKADAAPRNGRPAGQPWKILQRVDHPDVEMANRLLLEDLAGGADGIDLVLISSANAHGYGCGAQDAAGFDRLFEGVYSDLITIRVDGGYESGSALALLAGSARRKGLDPSQLNVISCSDYVTKLIHTGTLKNSVPVLRNRIADLVRFARGQGLSGPIMCADGRGWHNRGATDAQELAFTLATALHYLRDLVEGGAGGDNPASLISVTLAATADQTATIAKARAMRRLWAAVLEECGLPQHHLHLHMETSWRMLTKADPYVNMLRGTVACFAAGVGGADSVCVLPFTSACGLPDSFARRVARNTQAILIEESNLHRVADPGAGSGAIEARTEDLIAAAWALFQETEAAGGIVEAMVAGTVQKRVETARTERSQKIARRRQQITGVSAFPNLQEGPVRVLSGEHLLLDAASSTLTLPRPGEGSVMQAIFDALEQGATLTDIMASRPLIDDISLKTRMPEPERLSEPFERLREAAALSKPAGRTVFLAALGPLADFTARATWAKNFFEAGGLPVTGGSEADGIGAIVEAWRASGAPLVCLVSSDKIYSAQGAQAAAALSAAGAKHIYLAGKPGDLEASLKEAGVNAFVFEGCAMLDILADAHRRLGVPVAAGTSGEGLL